MPALHGTTERRGHRHRSLTCPLARSADNLIKSGNSLLIVNSAGSVVWSSTASVAARVVADTILDGDAIDDYAAVCSDAARKAYG